MIRTLRIAYAGVMRHRLEAPIRTMWADMIQPGAPKRAKLMKFQFGSIVNHLKSKGYIEADDARAILREYGRLSEILHGRLS
jgi:hypothetical protein